MEIEPRDTPPDVLEDTIEATINIMRRYTMRRIYWQCRSDKHWVGLAGTENWARERVDAICRDIFNLSRDTGVKSLLLDLENMPSDFWQSKSCCAQAILTP